MKFKMACVSVVLCAGLVLADSAFATSPQSAQVFLKSDPGSYVGGGIGAQSVTWVNGIDGIFNGGPNYGSFLRGVNISYYGSSYWTFDFSAPSYDPTTNTNSGQLLHVGLYTNAQRFPFNSPTAPGIDISGNGRGNNTESGWFDVLQISYDFAGNLDQFAVDFKQYDESSTTDGLYGSLRFNSAIPINTTFPISPIPEPSVLSLMLLGAAALGGQRAAAGRRRAALRGRADLTIRYDRAEQQRRLACLESAQVIAN